MSDTLGNDLTKDFSHHALGEPPGQQMTSTTSLQFKEQNFFFLALQLALALQSLHHISTNYKFLNQCQTLQ